jgi:hypothetical protein
MNKALSYQTSRTTTPQHSPQKGAAECFSLFFITVGFHLWKGKEPHLEVPTEDTTKFAIWMSKVCEEAGAAMWAAQETMKRFYDTKQQADPDYKPGDKIYLSRANPLTHSLMKKLEDWCYGPFTVARKVGAILYELKLPESWQVHMVSNSIFPHPWVPPVAEHQHHDLYEITEVLKIWLNKQ